MQEQTNLTAIVRDLWTDFFPNKSTHPDHVAQAVANSDWIKNSLLYYGWKPDSKASKLDINISFIDGGAVLYHNKTQPCALISVKWSNDVPSLAFTYVDNRP